MAGRSLVRCGLRRLAAVLLPVHLAAAAPPAAVQTLQSDAWGEYRVVAPAGGAATRIAFVFGAPADARLDATTAALAARGALVARIDPARFAAGLRDETGPCLDLAGIVNWHANDLGRRFGLADLAPPLLVGAGAGAAVVYAVLVQAPPQEFAAAVSDVPPPRLAMPKALCGVTSAPAGDGRVRLHALPAPMPWTVVGEAGANDLLAAVRRLSPPGRVRRVTGALQAAATATFDTLATTDRAPDSVADLSLVELAPARDNDTLVVVYSGDGGWRDLDKTIAGLLAKRGIGVVGVDSVRYFWHRRSPEQTAADLARILDHYQRVWGSRRVALVGYSFGADILPFAYNRLPAGWQERVHTLALLAPGRGADFEVSIAGWLGRQNPAAAPILPELQRIPPAKVLCVYGARETADSLCTAPGAGAIARLRRPGEHHFDHRYDIIADAIRAHLAGAGPRP